MILSAFFIFYNSKTFSTQNLHIRKFCYTFAANLFNNNRYEKKYLSNNRDPISPDMCDSPRHYGRKNN